MGPAPPDRPGLADPRAVVAAGVVAIAIALATAQPGALALVATWLLAAVLGWIAAEARRLPLAAGEAQARWSATETALVALAAALAILVPIALLA